MLFIYADAMMAATRMEKDFLHDLNRQKRQRRRWLPVRRSERKTVT